MTPTTLTLTRRNSPVSRLFAACLLVCSAAGFSIAAAQDHAAEHGTSLGGKWTEYNAEDRMTAQKRARIELLANDASDADDRAKIILFCTAGKLQLSDFRPNTKLAGPDRPSFWGRPQMEVRVRADNHASTHSWNWVEGHFLAMDKGTTRELLGATLFRVEFNTPRGPEIAEFSPSGLDSARFHTLCGLTPKRP